MRREQEALSDPLIRALLDQQPHGIMVLRLASDDDASLTIVAANAKADATSDQTNNTIKDGRHWR